jgi:hypothetical protein
MIVISVAISLVLILVLVTPFFAKDTSALSQGSSINDPKILQALKDSLVKRYIDDDAAHKRGSLSALAWEKRRLFLVNRYVDAARRLDYLEKISEVNASGSAKGNG